MNTKSPKAEPLRFPRGVRFPRKNELPRGSESALDRIASANVTTGYTRIDGGGTGYSSYFEANIHADEVFTVFEVLARSLMPEIAAPIIGLKDEKPTFGPYTLREAVIDLFRPHRSLLENDGFLEFGITFQHKGRMEEVFVKSSKYFQIWTNEAEKVADIFLDAGIPGVATLEFIDEYPMVSKSIGRGGQAAWPGVYEAVKSAFGTLPRPIPEQ